MQLRSGRIKEYRPIQTRGFNVKGRAGNPAAGNVLLTSDIRKAQLAATYGVEVKQKLQTQLGLVNAYARELELNTEKSPARMLLIGYGADFLYYGRAPLVMRGPRGRAAKPRPNQNFPFPPSTDEVVIEVEYTEPVTAGSDRPSRDGAMGGSALNYAREMVDPDWASARQWEWLHIVGHALGGNNEVGNLVAGTFDANTQMIPHERNIRDATQTASLVTVKYEVALYPDSWVALDIRMTYSWIGANGFNFITQSFPTQTDMTFDKLQYDMWLLG
jgi:hypothetical protein